ncbi:MAG: FlgD immunoglobulin-like domain containing protein [Candidatus Eisenbacteria bacterium]
MLLALVMALVPVHAYAAFRGVWDPLTNGAPFQTGLANGCEQPSLRPGTTFATAGHSNVERWYAFTTRSTTVGSETVRSIWQGWNIDQAGFRVANIANARTPLLVDPASVVSYTDPAWSPNGKYLAYVQSDGALTQSAIYVQEYAIAPTMAASTVAVGSPLLIVPASPGVLNRNPDWKPDGTGICYASTAAGPSLDIWYVSVDMTTATVGAPARATNVDTKAEVTPTWGSGNRIAYSTNKFGRNVIEIVDLDDMSTTLAETNFASVSHNNPSWSSDGNSIYYDAPQSEDINNNSDIWTLNLPTQAKCDIFFDNRGDADPDVSALTNTTLDGIPYNLLLASSQGLNFGLGIFRGSAVSCAPALPIGVAISPTTLNLGSQGQNITVTITMPPETQAAGYRAACDVPDRGPGIPAGTEGIKNRKTGIVSPTFLGLGAKTSPVNGSPFAELINTEQAGERQVDATYVRKTIEARLVALGLVNQLVPCQVTAYSNLRGRQFQGFGYLRIAANNLAGQVVRVEQNAPNPFNPVTKIKFAVAKPGFVNVRIYNVRGELVKTIASGNYGTGSHDATWDGSTRTGAKASGGVYFAKASVGDGNGGEVTSDVIKMVMAK